jgi:hypothetical protein
VADTTVPRSTRPDQLENVRCITQRGKAESAVLVVLAGTAASTPTADIKAKARPDLIDNGTRFLTRSPTGILLNVLTAIKADVIVGMDNFLGWPPPEPPFISPFKINLNSIDTSYIPYSSSTDVIGKAFRRIPYFSDAELFAQKQGNTTSLFGALVYTPVPTSDLTYRARMSTGVYTPEITDVKWKPSWFVPLQPGISIPRPPVIPFAGAGPTQGYFTGNTTLGYFN